jgi:hypothetical protein
MRIVSAIIVASTVILSIMLSSCKNTINMPIGDIVFPASGVSYSRQVQPLLNLGCNYSGCHDDGTRSANLCLTNYIDATTDVAGVVNFNGDTNCILIETISGRLPTEFMPPPPAASLNQNQIHGLATWIKEGAKDN